MKNRLLCLLPGLLSFALVQAQCPPGQHFIRLEIDPDQYFIEVSWQLTDLDGAVVYAADSSQSEELAIYNYCVPDDGCIVFRIMDQFGDGMPDGYYLLYLNDSLIHVNATGNYHFGENVYFGCPPGGFCLTPFVLDTGAWTSPAGLPETWYRFTPADTGTYRISTCFAANLCPTKFWMYDHCEGISLSDNQTGANFYADGGCNQGATAEVYLAANKTYFIRLRYANDSCANAPIHFSIHYTGAVIGCTDPAACNYNPLATFSTTCIYPGDPACPAAPDLAVLEDELRNSMYAEIMYHGDLCEVNEGCLRGTGMRTLIRFTTHIKNIGSQDYYIGAPPENPNTPSTQFVWDPCHNHWHYRGYAEYVLYNASGLQLPIGSKNGFCVLDLECDTGSGKFECENMGITVGCGDIYDASLPCQWVDITDLPADSYTLVVRVNWDKSPDKVGRVESNYANNWAQACFNLSYNGTLPNIEFLETNCPQYTDCLGLIFGDAQPDCEGLCNGPVLRGDWDKNEQRDSLDLDTYLAAALSGNETVTECRDLHADGQIDLFDAALLQECNLHANDPGHWGVRVPCDFPTGLEATGDAVYLYAGLLDTVAKTFDVRIVNPFNNLIGYACSVSGLQIVGVENLMANFEAPIQFDAAAGRILALSATEKPILKHFVPTNLLRIHYQELTAQQACLTSVEAVVNAKYQKSHAVLGSPNCASGNVSATQELAAGVFPVFVQPNPFHGQTTLFFANPNQEMMRITLTNLTGQILRDYPDVRTDSLTFELGDLPAGVYLYTVQNSRNKVSGKVLAW
ncbi:MAG: lysyl oxidase family protein [Saprospiraceae bacterium]